MEMTMNSRQRFRETMHYGKPDRAPYFEEGIRPEVMDLWRRQGMPEEADVSTLFPVDRRLELALEVDPRPYPRKWPTKRSELAAFRRRLDPDDPNRWPAGWPAQLEASRRHEPAVMLRIHRGLFETMGIGGWKRFAEVIYLLVDDPAFVSEVMIVQAEFAARLAERVLQEVAVDAVIFSEPISGNDGPLVSPKMVEELVLPSYELILDVVRRYGVKTIILRTYANTRALLPSYIKWGFNCLWASEVNLEAMDYRDLRREFGLDLRLIGGIDLDALRQNKEAIRREVEEKVPPLLAQGGYVPLADGRIRADVSYENYAYYRRLLSQLIGE